MILHPKSGVALELKKNDKLKIINTYGTQVVDVAIFNANNLRDKLSLSYSTTRYALGLRAGANGIALMGSAALSRDYLTQGDILVSTIYTELMEITEDSTRPIGYHKVNQRMCNRRFYESFGVYGVNGCHEILSEVLSPYGIAPEDIPDTIDFFMNYKHDCRTHSWVAGPPVSKPGDYVLLTALNDCLVGISNCPEEYVSQINGGRCRPMEIEVIAG